MTGTQNMFRGWIIYGSILPLAILLGYFLSNPLSIQTFAAVGLVLLVLITPLILRFHHPILIASWNTTAVVGVLPGRPQLWLVMAFVSLMVFVVQYAMVRNVRFVKNQSILYPLLFLGVVVLVTGQLTGGMGLKLLGSENIGGRRYLYIFAAIAGYFAITARSIPPERAVLYVGLFFLASISNAIGNLLPYAPSFLYPLFSFFPVEHQGLAAVAEKTSVVGASSISRVQGFSSAMMALAWFLVARNGLAPLLNLRRPAFWIMAGAIVLSLTGGFRSFLVATTLTLGILFVLEGLHKTRLMPILAVAMILVFVGLVAFVQRLPASIQRSMSVVPLVQVDPVVEFDARASSEWRLEMWRALLPNVPKYLLLGKGLAFDREEYERVATLSLGRWRSADIAAEAWIVTGDYHSGPLTVLIPFGLWGGIGLGWLFIAGTRGLYHNYRYGDPALKNINTFLLASFIAKVAMYVLIFGNFYSDLAEFAGLLALSLALNNGIRKPSTPSSLNHGGDSLARPRLIPSFSNSLPR